MFFANAEPAAPTPYFTSLWNTAMNFCSADHMTWDEKGQYLLELTLLWLGAAVVVGGIAKLLVPGNQPRGTWGTLMVGMGGCTLASFLMQFILVNLLGKEMYRPFSFLEIIASIIFASMILAVYGMTAGSIEIRIVEKEKGK